MKRLYDPQWGLVFLFLGLLATVPLLQLAIELREGEGVRALEIFNQAPTAANLRAYERSLESVNWASRLCRPWFEFARFQYLREGGEKAVIGRDGWYFDKPGLHYMLSRLDRAAKGTNDALPAILDFRDQLAAYGIQLLVMPVPNKESIYPEYLTSRAESQRSVLAPRTRDLLQRLRAAGVEYIDLFREFREARQAGGSARDVPLYLSQDTHWSPAGVALAAQSVARRLRALGWTKPGAVEYGERPAAVRRLGDIVQMLQVPLIEHHVPLELAACTQVVRQSNSELYRDAAEAEILVLGDSFMRIYQQDEPRAAGFIAHLAKELQQPMMSLINDGGGATLVRQELRARPIFLKKKKIVLWEFVERDIGLGVEGWKLIRLPPPDSLSAHEPDCETRNGTMARVKLESRPITMNNW